MKLLYARPYGFDVGSVYKYGEMFGRIADVVDVIGDRQAVSRAIESHRPDAGLVGGDFWRHFEAFSRARVPYLLVEHDVLTIRTGHPSIVERRMIERAAAVLFTSEDHREYCAERYRLPRHEVVHLRPLAATLDFEALPKLPGRHLVYAGGIASWRDRGGTYGYRAYHRVFEAFTGDGWTVHVYPCYLTARGEIAEYERLGCVMHAAVPEPELPRELSQYTAGLQAYSPDCADPDAAAYVVTCRPNKTWSYLGAGIPTIGFNTGNCSALYNGRWGVVLEDLAHIPELALPTVSDAVRRSEVMDADLPAFERLLAAVGDARSTMGALIGRTTKGVIVKQSTEKMVTVSTRIYEMGADGIRRLRYRPGAKAPASEVARLTGASVKAVEKAAATVAADPAPTTPPADDLDAMDLAEVVELAGLLGDIDVDGKERDEIVDAIRAARAAEKGQDAPPPAPAADEKPVAGLRLDDLKALAAAEHVDTEGCNVRADYIAAIEKARAAK